MRQNNPEVLEDHYFSEGDMVKLKHYGKTKFEFKWKGPYHVVRLGHPGTYWIMSPLGDVLQSTVNQRDLAPWLSSTSDNAEFFYDGTTRSRTTETPNSNFSGVELRAAGTSLTTHLERGHSVTFSSPLVTSTLVY